LTTAAATVIGANVTVGHKAMIHGCTIEEDALIGMGATLLNGCVIGAGAIVAAGAVVGEGVHVPPRAVVMGIPAKVRKEISEAQVARVRLGVEHYVERAQHYL
jgi:carbonic anhydrase/acetyltransferase-like protein (isoleucine patch superfamily)